MYNFCFCHFRRPLRTNSRSLQCWEESSIGPRKWNCGEVLELELDLNHEPMSIKWTECLKKWGHKNKSFNLTLIKEHLPENTRRSLLGSDRLNKVVILIYWHFGRLAKVAFQKPPIQNKPTKEQKKAKSGSSECVRNESAKTNLQSPFFGWMSVKRTCDWWTFM